MSDQTRANLDAALQAHVNNETEGYFIGGWVTQIYLVPVEDDGRHHYSTIYPDTQPYHSTLGLLHTALDDFVVEDE